MIKNLGQIAGLWVGNTSPQNRLLIWFDTGNNIHKTYDYSTGTWIPVSMNPIVNKTYAELQNLAALNSISQGTFYRITDLGYLALAITSTKIQYTDNNDNVIIDDLISTKTYCVTSSNLLIEDKGGVWDVSTNTLKFNFEDTNISSDPSATTADDYVLGTKLRSGTKKLSKYKFSSLISRVTGNSISWNKGFFLNFLTNLQSYYDVNGGVVRYTTYTAAINTINQSLNTLQQNINNLNIWNKTMPSPFNPPATPTNMAANDTLKTLLQKVQAWINKFKNAKGIVLSSDYAVDDSGVPAIGDTVEQAIGKIQYEAQGLPSNWSPSTLSTEPTVAAGDTFSQAFAKVQQWFNLFWHITSTRFYSRSVVSSTVPVFDFNSTNKEFKVSRSNSSYSSFSGGKNELKYNESEVLNFIQDESKSKNLIGSDFSFEITEFIPNSTPGTITLNSYTIKVDEPIIPNPLLSSGQVFKVNDIYSIYAKSLKTDVRSSKVSILDALNYDLTDNSSNAQTFYITKDSPEHIVFYKSSGSGDLYMNFGINSLREGQIIGITFLSGSLEFGINLINTGTNLPIWLPIEDGNLPNPQLGGVSISLPRNSEQKFVVINGSQIGYSQYPLILTKLN